MRILNHLLLTALVLSVMAWCVASPFLWAFYFGDILHIPKLEMLGFYRPELIVGAIVVVCLPLALYRKRIAIVGLLFAALLAPILSFALGSPSSELWPVSAVLLALLSWRLYALPAAQP